MAPGEGRAEQKPRSLFDLRPDFFDSCRLLSDPSEILSIIPPSSSSAPPSSEPCIVPGDPKGIEERGNEVSSRWTCNTCKVEFDSLEDQRSHFKSDVHRLNVKLTVAGKSIIKEEDCDELGDESVFKDYDVSSISGSEDEFEKGSIPNSGISGKAREGVKQKLYIRLESGDTVSVWRCLILNESEDLTLEKNTLFRKEIAGSCVDEGELINRLKYLVHEPRDKTRLRTVLLASGGHFAGCVFDGNSVVAHKTFHRYVVRAKAGKQQSSKDASGKAANSAGSSLRRYNESALKKEIQELLVTWKPYFDASSCIFIYAPSKNRQLLFGGEKPELSFQNSVVRHVPLTVRRPTLKEAKRLYNHLTHIAYEVNDIRYPPSLEDSPLYTVDEGKSSKQSNKEQLGKHIDAKEISPGACSGQETISSSTASEDENISLSHNGSKETPLHEASKCGNAQQVLELLEQGLDPCVKDARGRTPYTLAIEKEVRNTFRRFMALNLDKWDWQAAGVPSPLTKEMEDSQAAKQVEKDAKRKAKAKELKKLRKAKEKAQAQAALSQSAATVVSQGQGVVPVSKGQPQSNSGILISKEEEQKRALAAEREKRAAAAERRIAELNARASSSEPKSGSDVICSCCNASLAGKIPFHRYNYKYCSTSCMHVHREMLEDG